MVHTVLALFTLAIALLASPALADEASRFVARTAGSYRNADPRVGTNTMIILPRGRDKAYIEIHTTWSNAHQCDAAGLFRVDGARYVYEKSEPVKVLDQKTWTWSANGRTFRCRMTISHTGDHIDMRVIDLDTNEGIPWCLGACGARGSFDRESRFKLSQRRPIRKIKAIEESENYKAGVADTY